MSRGKLRIFWIGILLFLGHNCAQAQISAGFSATPVAGCAPLFVNFSDLSTGPVTGWSWDFGNGNTSALQNPSTVYGQPGSYDVRLIVSDGSQTDTLFLGNYITVYGRPEPGFTFSPTSGCVPLTVAFTDTSLAGTGTITSWLWDFGDGAVSSSQNPSHTYTNAGSFTISLTVSNSNGCAATSVFPNIITASDPPQISFSASPDNACFPPLSTTFSSSIVGSGPFTYAWDFGDGTTGTGANPAHTYTSSGSYNVRLVVSDQFGCSDSLTQSGLVHVGVHNAAFSANFPVCVGSPMSFTDLSTGGAVSWEWDFGDGGTSTQQNPQHIYASSGNYTVRLIITTSAGCRDTLVRSNYAVVNPGPTPNFTADTTYGCQMPVTINFTNLTNGANTYSWDFGDGTTSTQINPTHTYTTPGVYTVTLSVVRGNGCTASLVRNNYIVIDPPQADFQASPLQGCLPLQVSFSNLSFSSSPITSYQWDFGDGGTSTQAAPTYTYTTTGLYTVSLVITNSSGCTDTLVRTNYVQAGPNPVADFTVNRTLACFRDSMRFTDLSTNANSWLWDFGDGNTSTQQNPVHVYANTGCYTVTLTAFNNGCPDQLSRINYVCITTPVAGFVATPVNGCDTPLTITITDTSTGANIYEWDFGNGDKDSVPNPTYTYQNFGTYTLLQMVTDTVSGCQDTQSVTISIVQPTAAFSAVNTTGCRSLTTTFTDNSFATSPIVRWFWDFGDGNTSGLQNPTHTYTNFGSYTVSLVIETGNGCSDTLIQPNLVRVYGPVAGFQANFLSGCPGSNISFADTSFSQGGGPVTAWAWDFGDGGSSSLTNPVHPYATPGTYTVSQIVTDSAGCQDTAVATAYISITQPVAGFTLSDTFICPGDTVSFNNISTGSGLSYSWDFGDGNSSTAANPVHPYNTAGTFLIRLQVTDTNSCVDVFQATVVSAFPQANFGLSSTSGNCPPFLAQFSDSSSQDIVSWFWDFGNGANSSLQNPSVVYTSSGNYTVTLVVTSQTGCTDTLQRLNFIQVGGPTGTFTFSPDTACAPQSVTFAANSPTAINYTWDFGDGTIVNAGDTVSHFYQNAGTFTPTLILGDSSGCTSLVLPPGNIILDTVPAIDFSAVDTVICGPDSVYFTDLTNSAFPITSWFWDFGDGTTGSGPNPVHFYAAPGMYTVTLTVANAGGCSASLQKPAYIFISAPPVTNLYLTDSLLCVNERVRVIDSTQYLNVFGSRNWDMGDGYSDSLLTFIHSYDSAGTYTITLQVMDSVGCGDTLSRTVTVLPGPVAAFTANDLTECVGIPVNFTDQSTGAVSWSWDFGNGATSTNPNPANTYNFGGYYPISLAITDSAGCTDTLVVDSFIRILEPVAGFYADTFAGCLPQTIQFTDSSRSDTTIVSWLWSFGDGNTGAGNPVSHTYTTYGNFEVVLYIQDAAGCRDSFALNGVINYQPPAVPQIHSVSVLSDSEDSLSFSGYPISGFDRYVILAENPPGSGNFIAIDSITLVSDTHYVVSGLNTLSQSHCYRLQAVDQCDERSNPDSSRVHCTMELTASPGVDMVMLAWSPYVGWDSVQQYDIYRVTDYSGPGTFIGTVPGNITGFVDTVTFCGQQQCYRILARDASPEAWISWSDTACATPVHYAPVNSPGIIRATVENNQDVRLDWAAFSIPWMNRIYIDRSTDNLNWNQLRVLSPGVTTLLDTSVNVAAQSYYYRISVGDSCGDLTPFSNLGRSILLTLSEGNGVMNLAWNAYEAWGNGVSNYLIEIRRSDQTIWNQLVSVPAVAGQADYTFTDNLTQFEASGYCYRIRAIENGGNGAESLSNEACSSTEIWVPNTITPNGDGANDFLEIPALAFYPENEIRIYNRWGSLVYEQSGYQDQWDGRDQQSGEPLPDATYYYVLEIPVLDEIRKGYVTILR